MTPMSRRSLCLLMLTTAVAGCSGSPGGKSADWAADACKTFPAEAAAKAAGVPVAKAEASGTGNDVTALSNCTYSSADGKVNFGVMLRQSKDGSGTVDEQLASIKSQPDVTGPSVDVAMPKGKAVWVPKLRSLSYVPADGRMIVVTPPGAISFGMPAVPEAELKAKAIAVAAAVESGT